MGSTPLRIEQRRSLGLVLLAFAANIDLSLGLVGTIWFLVLLSFVSASFLMGEYNVVYFQNPVMSVVTNELLDIIYLL